MVAGAFTGPAVIPGFGIFTVLTILTIVPPSSIIWDGIVLHGPQIHDPPASAHMYADVYVRMSGWPAFSDSTCGSGLVVAFALEAHSTGRRATVRGGLLRMQTPEGEEQGCQVEL